MLISTVGNPKNSQNGFTYVMILVAVIVMGMFAEVATTFTSRAKQMDNEAELLFRGMAYRDAIRSYYESGKPIKSYPKSLNDLIKDPRYIHKSHLRALYSDPFGKNDGEWRLIRANDGGISGVSSQSKLIPLKTGNFRPEYEKFENSTAYADWIFEYVPKLVSGVPTAQHPI